MTMPLHPTWQDIAIRLLLTVLAGALIGLNREARGHAAGFRTTILVGLAACVSMVQANILLSVGGKAADSFGMMDVLRFPLGVLTGVGFIGGGAILKRGTLVTGVTTAATLWVMTAIGLCFGGGQIGVGVAATVLVAFTLWVLKWLDMLIPREHRAVLVIAGDPEGAAIPDLDALIGPAGYRARFLRVRRGPEGRRPSLAFDIRWTRAEAAGPPLDLVALLERRFAVESFELAAGTEH
jgi:putative Mg2+ transporter-C (MgtC) family protein